MKVKLAVLTLAFFITITVKGQNLFFIGENSFPCTETLTFQSNADDSDDLNVLFAKDGDTALIAVIAQSSIRLIFSERLIIYLEDGSVITSNQRKVYDYVDNLSKAAYLLTDEQLTKLKTSNIHTIRYSLELRHSDGELMLERSRTASNKGISTKTIIKNFF